MVWASRLVSKSRVLSFAQIFRSLVLIPALAWALPAAEPKTSSEQYKLFSLDLVHISVQGEPDVSVDRRVDGDGRVNVPLLGDITVRGLSIAEAQKLIAQRYVEGEIFIRPEVVINVVAYSPKEIMVLGQVSTQGKVSFPPEVGSISIVEAITKAGGFTRIGKADGVRVTRKVKDGPEQSFTVNVEKLIGGRADPGDAFFLQPGDVVFVPERVF
jgi:protein involved in polysaccharide export with SLBB domain